MSESPEVPNRTYAFQSSANSAEPAPLSLNNLSEEGQNRFKEMSELGRKLSEFALNIELSEPPDTKKIDLAS